MKYFFLFCCSVAAGVSLADENPSAVVWAQKNTAEIVKQDSPVSLAALLQGGPGSLTALFAQVKPNGETCPFVATQIAALTQFVMKREFAAFRGPYAYGLLAAAQNATAPDVTCFFLYQLRWCGLPEMTPYLAAFEKSDKKCVAGLATMTITAINDAGIGVTYSPVPPPPAATEQDVAKMLAALAAATAPETKIQWLDALGTSRATKAADAVCAYVKDENPDVADAALLALGHISSDALSSRIPCILRSAGKVNKGAILTALRQVSTSQLKTYLITSYAAFTPEGKKIALELISQRRMAEGMAIGIDAISAPDAASQVDGYRLLREIAGKEQSPVLLAKVFSTKGRVTPEAESALVAVSKVDGGIIIRGMVDILQGNDPAAKEIALETSSRIGGPVLLEAVTRMGKGKNAVDAANAASALAAWSDAGSLPALFSLVATSPEAKCRKLALAGLKNKLTAPGVDKMAYFAEWKTLRDKAVDPLVKQDVDRFFAKEENILKGKPVTTNVPQEGNNVPANLTDGSLAKAWYGHGMPGIATVDIGSLQTLHAAHVTFYYADARSYTFKLELSQDGKDWKRVAGNEGAVKPATEKGIRMDFEETKARYVRLTVLNNSANPFTHVLELEAFRRMAL